MVVKDSRDYTAAEIDAGPEATAKLEKRGVKRREAKAPRRTSQRRHKNSSSSVELVPSLPPDSRSSKTSPPISQEDSKALDAFCDAVSFEDMSFERFQEVGSDLDLRLPLPLSEEDRDKHKEKHYEISYTRTLKRLCGERIEVTRERVHCKILCPKNPQWGQVITLQGMGDQDQQGLCGDVLVVLQPKSVSLKKAK